MAILWVKNDLILWKIATPHYYSALHYYDFFSNIATVRYYSALHYH